MNPKSNPVKWFEIYVSHMPRAKAFYENTFETKLNQLDNPGIELWAFPMDQKEYGSGGALAKMEGVEPGPTAASAFLSTREMLQNPNATADGIVKLTLIAVGSFTCFSVLAQLPLKQQLKNQRVREGSFQRANRCASIASRRNLDTTFDHRTHGVRARASSIALPSRAVVMILRQMAKPKRTLTAAEKRARRKRRKETMTIFINGKQKRVKRAPTIEGMDVEEFIVRNADPILLHQNEMWHRISRD